MWVTKLLISPVKKRTFCPKTTKFGRKLAFLVNLGQAMQAYSVPCWWLWRAGCISQDTHLLYDGHITHILIYSTVDCEWKWTDWSDCTTTCERGTTTRLQIILQQAMYGGALCPNKTSETKDCNTDVCCPGEF